MTEIETELEPHSVLNDVGWESMAFIGVSASIHSDILAQRQLSCQYQQIRATAPSVEKLAKFSQNLLQLLFACPGNALTRSHNVKQKRFRYLGEIKLGRYFLC